MNSFVFQQPGRADLLQAIDAAATTADSGGGVFAFASKGGIEAFFGVSAISSMLSHRKPFYLVVGVDAITNAEALLYIAETISKRRGTLTAKVFFHEHPASTFHPKFLWFRKGKAIRLIVGSGNLTLRGLGQTSTNSRPPGNWEVFTAQTLMGSDADAVMRSIDEWFAAQRAIGSLCELDDGRVKNRAMANGLVRYTQAPAPASRPPGKEATARRTTPVDDTDFSTHDILVREIPRNRHGQADVGKSALTDFFGYAGFPKDVLIQHVSLTNQVGAAEKIRLFVNESQNYRLELHAIANISYDVAADDSRLILVATKLDRRSFRYTVVPVTFADHALLVRLLGPMISARRQMREKRVNGEELRRAWPNTPTELLPIAATTLPP